MNKINITIDVSKIDKSKIVDRKFTTKDGQEVVIKEYKMELIQLKEPKFVKEGDTYKMIKTHFVKESQTKEEKAEKRPDNFIGDGFVFEPKESPVESDSPRQTSAGYNGEKINVEDIPF